MRRARAGFFSPVVLVWVMILLVFLLVRSAQSFQFYAVQDRYLQNAGDRAYAVSHRELAEIALRENLSGCYAQASAQLLAHHQQALLAAQKEPNPVKLDLSLYPAKFQHYFVEAYVQTRGALAAAITAQKTDRVRLEPVWPLRMDVSKGYDFLQVHLLDQKNRPATRHTIRYHIRYPSLTPSQVDSILAGDVQKVFEEEEESFARLP